MTCNASSNQNSNKGILDNVKEYIGKTKWVILSTVTQENLPALRTLGSIVNDDLNIYFSTGKNTAKVAQIESNPFVTLLFQHEGQELATFINVTYTGKAEKVSSEQELAKAIALLSNRSPRFKERAEKGQLDETAIFKVEPVRIKYLDYSQGIGPAAVQEIVL
ncbi:MAG TPA: pyridoxamine 5'-phosphate oxidase family protein [Pelotomaculum sp.]|nr:pyridoxamine 5'-phosphate oxidase family protein [Pelotomaculum sp.]